jgi:unconventional prefoldin RPB5 interactor 1
MGIPKPNLDALEEQRLALEDNILQLQKSLYHWRTWEAEYDGVREEISHLEDDASTDEFIAVASEVGGTLVDEKEMRSILGTQGIKRSRGQVVDLLGRRIDYVKQNVATMEKRLQKAEDELQALLLDDQTLRLDGADFPMQEIVEELDEDGNVISSKINVPGNEASELLEVLKKVGVKDIPETAKPEESAATPAVTTSEDAVNEDDPSNSKAADQLNGSSSGQNGTAELNAPSLRFSQPQSLVTAEDRMQPPVTDVNESAEEARLRREMLDYGINEVGAIVAELEMDESGSDISFDEEYDYDDDEEDNEDDYGRSHTRLTPEYHQQMIELEAKLNARGLMNMGKDTQTFPEEVQKEINEPEVETSKASDKEKKPKKKVAFADDLDISPAPTPPAPAEKASAPQAEPQVLADSIVERTSGAPTPPSTTPAVPKKASRFRSALSAPSKSTTSQSITTGATLANPSQVTESRLRKQANAIHSTVPPVLFPATPKEPKAFSTPITDITDAAEKPTPPQFPHDRTLAEKVFERQVKEGTIKAPELDHYDEELHQKQIASEFFHMQNRMKGVSESEEEQQILGPESEDPPKMSKFKASRLG